MVFPAVTQIVVQFPHAPLLQVLLGITGIFVLARFVIRLWDLVGL